MAQYYYLVSGLPELLAEALPKQLDHIALREEILAHLSRKDTQWVEQLYWPYDNAQLLKLSREYIASADKRDFFADQELEEPSGLGWYSIREMKQAFKELEGLPAYMLEFIERVMSWDRLNAGINYLEHDLLELFYQTVNHSESAFIRQYYAFDVTLRNILLAHTVRKLHKQEIHTYFIGEEELVQLLKKNTSSDFGIKGIVEYSDTLFQILGIENWIEREQKLDLLRWSFVDQQIQFKYFSTEVVLAFLLKLQWVDRWLQWNPEKGKAMLTELSEQVEGSIKLEVLTQ